MNFLPSLPAFILCCFVYFGLTNSMPLEPNSDESLNQWLRQIEAETYRGFLLYSIPAASSGKILLKMQHNLSEDCIKTAIAITQSFFQPSSERTALVYMLRSINATVEFRMNSTFDSQVNMLCNKINEEMKEHPYSLLYFDDWKKAAKAPKPTKNYIMDLVPDTNSSAPTPMPFDDPEMVKFQLILTVMKYRVSEYDESKREPIITAKAIFQLSQEVILKTFTMDKVFKEAFDDFIKIVPTQGDNKFNADNDDSYASVFLKKLDQHFLNNEELKEDYRKVKEKVMEKIVPKPKSLH